MEILKAEFLAGFNEGWANFWSPFAALLKPLQKSWSRLVFASSDRTRSNVVSH